MLPQLLNMIMTQTYSHLVFRASGTLTPFSDRDRAVFFWNQLRSRLRAEETECLALVLMPNHGHIVIPADKKEKVLNIIRVSILSFTRQFPEFPFWDPIPPPRGIEPSRKHVQRQIRYVHLNPCRSSLVPDPISWEFSTHRDYLGYTVDSLRVPSLQDLGFPSETQFHKYISSDPSASVNGTPYLKTIRDSHSEFPLVSLDRIAHVSIRLTRAKSDALSRPGPARRLFYALVGAAGYKNKALIGRYLKISQQSVSEFLRRGRTIPYSREVARQLLCDLRF